MTRPADNPEDVCAPRCGLYVGWLLDALVWLDDAIVAAGRFIGHAMVDGLAAYGLAHGGAPYDLQSPDIPEERGFTLEFSNDDLGLDECEDIHALIRSIKERGRLEPDGLR